MDLTYQDHTRWMSRGGGVIMWVEAGLAALEALASAIAEESSEIVFRKGPNVVSCFPQKRILIVYGNGRVCVIVPCCVALGNLKTQGCCCLIMSCVGTSY